MESQESRWIEQPTKEQGRVTLTKHRPRKAVTDSVVKARQSEPRGTHTVIHSRLIC
jgi:hypothetical protein